MKLWNVGVVGSERGRLSEQPLGHLGQVTMVKRSRLSDESPLADIKALMSRADAAFDCPDPVDTTADWEAIKAARRGQVGERPLLLLYPIDRASEAKPGSKSRQALDAAHDVLGFGLVMPGSRATGGNYISVLLSAPSPEELEQIEAEEQDAVEAAGVANVG